jgi:hypothetical protein
LAAFCLVFSTLLTSPPGIHLARAETEVPRVVLGIYDSRSIEIRDYSELHTLAEMPLNHLGLMLRFHDIQDGVPSAEDSKDLRGVLSWLNRDDMPDPEGYLAWAEQMINQGRKFVIFGQLGFTSQTGGQSTPPHLVNRFLNRLGLEQTGTYRGSTFDVAVISKDSEMVEFERPVPKVLPSYEEMKSIDPRVRSYLVVRKAGDPSTDSHLITQNPTGGYVSSGYIEKAFDDLGDGTRRQWLINPFAFFRTAFGTDDLPKPDVTTLSGRRIYYSHIDGDGWRNVTELADYQDAKEPVLSAQVVLEKAIRDYPDLPVTVAPIAADLDKNWHGSDASLAIARETFLEPQVEAGTHTYSHPFKWEFFEGYKPEDEVPFLQRYGGKIAGNYGIHSEDAFEHATHGKGGEAAHRLEASGYHVPRAYGDFPFELSQEIGGSIDFINQLLPTGKRVELAQWSGNCRPYEAALQATRAAGVRNLNGGDSRFDADFPSHSSVPPVGRGLGASLQIYASNSNENTYTDLWNSRFFGFKYLPATFKNTETPRRLKPLNIYYHMYSGQKLAALKALIGNLDYVRSQEIAPIAASHYAAIGDGFYTTRLIIAGINQWRVLDRGALQTIRFDHAVTKTVDYASSKGVLGHRHHQGSLYVSLDEGVEAPLVALAPSSIVPADATQSLRLENARWRVSKLSSSRSGVHFSAQGFGDGEFAWNGADNGAYAIIAKGENSTWNGRAAKGPDGLLRFKVPLSAINPIEIHVSRVGTPTIHAQLEAGS